MREAVEYALSLSCDWPQCSCDYDCERMDKAIENFDHRAVTVTLPPSQKSPPVREGLDLGEESVA